MRRLFALALVLAVIPAAVAQDQSQEDRIEDLLDSPQRVMELYNANVDQVPSQVRSVIGGERVNVHIAGEARNYTYGVVMKKARIDRINDSALDKPSVKVYTDVATLKAIATADDPRQRALTAWNSKEIRHESPHWFTRIKLGAASFVLNILSWF